MLTPKKVKIFTRKSFLTPKVMPTIITAVPICKRKERTVGMAIKKAVIIRIDGLVRKNSGATIGGEVTVKKTKATEAKKVVLAPIENNIRVQGDVRGLFAGKVMVQGDIIGSQIRAPRPSMGFNSLFEELMDFTPTMKEIKFAVVSTNPKDIVIVGPNTEVQLHETPVDVSKIEGVGNLVDVSYEDIGGLKEEVKKVREMIEIPLKRPELFEKLGIAPPK